MDGMEAPSPYIQFLENWIPGIGEAEELHDQLHEHFNLDFSVRAEAVLLGFQLGHHPAGSFFHVVVFTIISTTIYPGSYRNSLADILVFYQSYLLGKMWQGVSYWFVPPTLLKMLK